MKMGSFTEPVCGAIPCVLKISCRSLSGRWPCLQHVAPMWLKLGRVFGAPASSQNRMWGTPRSCAASCSYGKHVPTVSSCQPAHRPENRQIRMIFEGKRSVSLRWGPLPSTARFLPVSFFELLDNGLPQKEQKAQKFLAHRLSELSLRPSTLAFRLPASNSLLTRPSVWAISVPLYITVANKAARSRQGNRSSSMMIEYLNR